MLLTLERVDELCAQRAQLLLVRTLRGRQGCRRLRLARAGFCREVGSPFGLAFCCRLRRRGAQRCLGRGCFSAIASLRLTGRRDRHRFGRADGRRRRSGFRGRGGRLGQRGRYQESRHLPRFDPSEESRPPNEIIRLDRVILTNGERSSVNFCGAFRSKFRGLLRLGDRRVEADLHHPHRSSPPCKMRGAFPVSLTVGTRSAIWISKNSCVALDCCRPNHGW